MWKHLRCGMIKTIFALTLMIIATVGLGFAAYSLNDSYPISAFLLTQSPHLLGCYVILGIGFGLPIVFLATVLGWVQLFLLLSGSISPHLARGNFSHVIKALFSFSEM